MPKGYIEKVAASAAVLSFLIFSCLTFTIQAKQHNFTKGGENLTEKQVIINKHQKNVVHLPIHKVAVGDRYETPLKNIQESEYLLTIKFGENKKPMRVLIDTGSADLWVLDFDCHQCDDSLKKFSCSQSSSCHKTNEQIQIEYDDGPIIGYVTYDTIMFEPNISIPKQSFMLVDSADDAMYSTPGIIGLGPTMLASNPHPQVLDHLLQLDMIHEKVFSLYLSNEDEDTRSRLIFGGIDESFIMSGEKLFYAPIISEYGYVIQTDGIRLSNKKNNQFYEFKEALVDSGSSCLIFPADFIDSFSKDFKDKFHIRCNFQQEDYAPSFYQMACIGRIENFPNITIQIQGQQLILRPQDYIYYCTIYDDEERYSCQTKIERSEIDNYIIMGDAFLESFYTVFDLQNNQIGFAHSINNRDIQIGSDRDSLMFLQTNGLRSTQKDKQEQLDLQNIKDAFIKFSLAAAFALFSFFIGYKIVQGRKRPASPYKSSRGIEIIDNN